MPDQLTLAHVPAQVAQTVPRVECERRREDRLASILDGVGQASDKLNDMRRVKGARCNKVGERVAVEN